MMLLYFWLCLAGLLGRGCGNEADRGGEPESIATGRDADFVYSTSSPDMTPHLESLGDPVRMFYDRPREKAGIYDLQAYEGKLYIGHGSTDTRQQTRVIFFDPGQDRFEVDRAEDGTPVAFNEELLRRFRVFGGDLYIEGYDPIGDTHFHRKDASGWNAYRIGPHAHARDIYFFDGKLFTNYGHSNAAFPRIYVAPASGLAWQAIELPDLFAGKEGTSYQQFFEYKGRLYTTCIGNQVGPGGALLPTGQPWMLAYTGDAGRPFEVALSRRDDFIADNEGFEYIENAVEVGERLFFKWGRRLFAATSIVPPQVQEVLLPDSLATVDFVDEGGTVYVLAAGPAGTSTRYTVSAVVGGEAAPEELFHFVSDESLTTFEVIEGDFYFGGGSAFQPERGSGIWRVKGEALREASPTGAERPEVGEEGTMLLGNYPNPFSTRTAIRYVTPHLAHVRLLLYDLSGRLIDVLVDEVQHAGLHEAGLAAEGLQSGLYLYQLQAGDQRRSRKMILVR